MNDFKTEIVTAKELAPGDLIERLGLTGLGWFVVTLVQLMPVAGFPDEVVWVEFAGAPGQRYLPTSSFKRRVEAEEDDETVAAYAMQAQYGRPCVAHVEGFVVEDEA